MQQLYFIRHGQSTANANDIWSGQSDYPLSELGCIQAKTAGQHAKDQGLSFDVIITSTLSRAQKTAEIIAGEIGYPLAKIVVDRLFIERTYGVLEGQRQDKNFLTAHNYQKLDSIKGAETVENLQKRAARGLEQLKHRSEQTILLVGHGAYGRALRRVITDRPFSDEYTTEFIQIPNAQILKLV